MKKIFNSLISAILAVIMTVTSLVAVSAASDIEEEYLCDMRIIYADDYYDALDILSETSLEGYEILNFNLNSNTDKRGVWLAYKTTTDVDDAITDIAVMQMGGGYRAGNYQQMIRDGIGEYLETGEIYLQAIEYFANAYAEGNFLAEAAYRQLNFYSGLDKYESDPLGDLFVDEILSPYDLATLFLQGNTYVLDNIRSLLSMGVSYNDDGMHYLEKVAASAKGMDAAPSVFNKKDYDELAEMIAPSIRTFRLIFEELSAYEDELNYEDDNLTDLEIKYSEYMALAEMLRSVDYLDGETLYEFCMQYTVDYSDYSRLYPLVDALNDGQIAMTELSRYYDVIRYSMTEAPVELIDQEIERLEEIYGEASIDVFAGVDRKIYAETFALTNRAYRADVYDDDNSLAEALFGDSAWMMTSSRVSSGAVGVGLSVWHISRASKVPTREAVKSALKAAESYGKIIGEALNFVTGESVSVITLIDAFGPDRSVYDVMYDVIYDYDKQLLDPKATLSEMYDCFLYLMFNKKLTATKEAHEAWLLATGKVAEAENVAVANPSVFSRLARAYGSKLKVGLHFTGAVVLAIKAFSISKKIYEHYHPNYDDVPTSIVDLVRTSEGDCYVKYNVVYEAKPQSDGGYSAADLNAYQGMRWNAVYYTKSSDAGKPLLAEFDISDDNNRAPEGYSAVHRFDEIICYDLNKYSFSSDSDTIFMSIEQSKRQKTATDDVPDVVGAMVSGENWILAGCIGFGLGAVITVAVQYVVSGRKKRIQ